MPASITRYDLLQKRHDLFTRMLRGLERGNVRALHRTRVASRRLRELLPVLQLEQAATRKLLRRLKRVTGRLGRVRELDVMLLLLDELHDAGCFKASGLMRVAEAVRRERGEARKDLHGKLPLTELHRLAGKLEDVARELKAETGASRRRQETAGRWAVDARIAHRAQRLDRAIREAGAVYLPDRLHAVRIAIKKLRYAMELRAEMSGIPRSEALRRLRRAQDLLGRMHDLQVLIERVRHVQAALTPPDLAAWDDLDALVDGLEDECRRLHGRYMRERAALAAICAASVAHTHPAASRRAS